MRKLLIAAFFLMIVSSDWTWSATKAETRFVPKSFSAKFTQEFKSLLTKKIKRSKGVIDYKSPRSIRFEMKGKSDLVFVSNEKKSWYFTPSKLKGQPSQLKMGKATDHNLIQFFDILKKGLKTNKSYSVEKKENKYTITFNKKVAKKIELLKAVLVFKNKKNIFENIKEIHLVRKKNKKVKMIFSKMKVGKKFSSGHFIFDIPEGTRIAN